MPQLICDRLNGVRTTRTILAAALRTLDRDASPLEHTVAGSCRLLTAGRWPEETRGRSRWTKGQRPWRPGDTAESVKPALQPSPPLRTEKDPREDGHLSA